MIGLMMYVAFWAIAGPAKASVRVLPTGGQRISTYAMMTEKQIGRFVRTLALFCPACRKAHVFTAIELHLEDNSPPRRT